MPMQMEHAQYKNDQKALFQARRHAEGIEKEVREAAGPKASDWNRLIYIQYSHPELVKRYESAQEALDTLKTDLFFNGSSLMQKYLIQDRREHVASAVSRTSLNLSEFHNVLYAVAHGNDKIPEKPPEGVSIALVASFYGASKQLAADKTLIEDDLYTLEDFIHKSTNPDGLRVYTSKIIEQDHEKEENSTSRLVRYRLEEGCTHLGLTDAGQKMLKICDKLYGPSKMEQSFGYEPNTIDGSRIIYSKLDAGAP